MDTDSRTKLIDATVDILRSDGLAGISARAIASRAGHNQALIYYHYGGITPLLVAALGKVGQIRMAAYEDLIRSAEDLGSLMAAGREVVLRDLSEGWVKVLSEVLSAAAADESMSGPVAEVLRPWVDLVESALRRVVPEGLIQDAHRPAAVALVCLLVGVNVLGSLHGDPLGVNDSILDGTRAVAPVLSILEGLS